MDAKTKTQISHLPTKLEVEYAKSSCLSDYYGIAGAKKLPVDIERLLEVVYDVDIVPTDGLEFMYSKDSILATDFKTIYIDKRQYEHPSFRNRVRFSLAHELGHMRLHQSFFQEFAEPVQLDDMQHFRLGEISPAVEKKLENQAYELAGGILVPKQSLSVDVARLLLQNMDVLYENAISVRQLLVVMAPRLAKTYHVSEKVIEVRIDREDLTNELKLNGNSPLSQQTKSNLSQILHGMVDGIGAFDL